LPAWGLHRVAQWYWLKVTDAGALASPMHASYRRPYERLLLARSASAAACTSNSSGAAHVTREGLDASPPPLPSVRVLIGSPGAHSRKPKLKVSTPQNNPDCSAHSVSPSLGGTVGGGQQAESVRVVMVAESS
jgi:hypothetical protein